MTELIGLLITLLVVALVFVIGAWILRLLGVPERAIQIVGAILALIVLLWLLRTFLVGGPFLDFHLRS